MLKKYKKYLDLNYLEQSLDCFTNTYRMLSVIFKNNLEFAGKDLMSCDELFKIIKNSDYYSYIVKYIGYVYTGDDSGDDNYIVTIKNNLDRFKELFTNSMHELELRFSKVHKQEIFKQIYNLLFSKGEINKVVGYLTLVMLSGKFTYG